MEFWGGLAGAGYLAVFWLAGVLLARRVFADETAWLQLCLGAGFGLGLLAALPALAALALGFNRAAALSALALAVLAGFWAAGYLPRLGAKPGRPAGQGPHFEAGPGGTAHSRRAFPPLAGRGPAAETGAPAALLTQSREKCRPAALPKREQLALAASVLPVLILTLWLLHTHTLHLADGAYWCGQSTYGDLPMHLAFIKSIAVQGDFPPSFPLLAGQQKMGYPFLCETVSSILLMLGAPLKAACLLPQALALLAVYGMFWLLARRILGGAGKAACAFFLFFMGGGFGFAYFLDGVRQNPANFTRIFTAFYETPTNYVEKNIRWVNPIADMLIPQRATLFGWALLLCCLYLLYRFAFENEARLWLPLGLLAGCLPLVQTHSLLALAVLSAVFLLRAALQALCRGFDTARLSVLRPWLWYAVLAAALCLPQLMSEIFPQTAGGNGFLRWHWNWANEGDNYFWFYIKNIGLVYLLTVPAFLHAGKKLRWLYGGGLAILLLAECIVFQPNNYDNNKLLFIWHMLGCLLAANFLCDGAAAFFRQAKSPRRGRAAAAGLLGAALFLGCFGGVLTLGREAVSRYEQFSAGDIALAGFVEQNAAPDALFLTGSQHVNPVASLAGRPILCGSSSYLYFHGMDYSAQAEAARRLYEAPNEELLAAWGIRYVCIGRYERSEYAVDEDFYAARYPVWYQSADHTVYAVLAK